MSRDAPLVPLDAARKARFAWTNEPPVRKVVSALEAAASGSARFVGGCVRDSLLGAAPKDIDIATVLAPTDVIAALKRAGLRAAPTGIDHGTVTGIADHVGVEITTLRADVSTDGRRATVAFTQDWAIDAARRDFTLNAIYLTTDNRLYDPVGGVADAEAGRVRFIGAPEDRIREDYLRILRFFRFSARFASGFDAEGLAACAVLKAGVGALSAERVGDELSKILALPSAPRAVEKMAETGVLSEVWAKPPALDVFRRLKVIAPEAPAPLGLAALWGQEGEGVDSVLRLSNADAARRRRAVRAAKEIDPSLDEKTARARLYRLGAEGWRDGVLVARAAGGDDARWARLADLPDRWPPPVFPVSGKDVVAAGVPKGPDISAILKAAEEAWIAEDFPPPARARALLEAQIEALRRR